MKTKLFTLATVAVFSFSACSKAPEWRKEFEQQIEQKLEGELKIKSVEIEQQKNSPEFAYIITTVNPHDLYRLVDARPSEIQKKGYQLWEEYKSLSEEDQKKAKWKNLPNTMVYEQVGKKGDTVLLKGFGVARGMKGNWQVQMLSMDVEGDTKGRKLPEDGVIAGSEKANEMAKRAIEAMDAFEERLKAVQEEIAKEEAAEQKAKEEAEAAKLAAEQAEKDRIAAINKKFFGIYQAGTTLEGTWTFKSKGHAMGMKITEVDEANKKFKGFIFDPKDPNQQNPIYGELQEEGNFFRMRGWAEGAKNRAELDKAQDPRAYLWTNVHFWLRLDPDAGTLVGGNDSPNDSWGQEMVLHVK